MGAFEIREDFYLNDQPFKILSGAIHYFRIDREDWYHSLYNLKALGFNTVETYVPWNAHEPQRGHFHFEGNLDLEYFIQVAQELDLYVILRPSPFICSEWEFGGLPAWLIERNYLLGAIPWALSRALPVYFALAFGGSFVETVVTGLANVQWLANGLKLAGQMLPGLGFAILLRYLPVRRNLHYLALGFGLTAMLTVLYSNVQSLGAAVSSIVGSEVFAKLPEEQAITFVNNFKSVSMIGIAIIGIFLAVQHFKNSQRTVVAAPVTESESGEIEDDEF